MASSSTIDRSLFPLALVFVLICGAALPSSAQDGPKVDGQVVDSAGRPLAGAEAVLEVIVSPFEAADLALGGLGGEVVDETTSDAAGRFVLRAPEAGFFRVRLEKEGHGSKAHVLHPLVIDTSLARATLASTTPSKLTLLGAEGRPIQGRIAFEPAEKKVDDRWAWVPRGWQPDRPLLSTDEKGRAELLLDAGVQDWWVEAAAPGHAPVRRRWSPGKSSRIALEPGIERLLLVVDAAGDPVAGAIVGLGGHRLPSIATGEDGTARLRVADRGALEVDALGPGGESARQTLAELEKGSEAEEPEVITLVSPDHIAGQIRDAETGAGLPGALVWEPKAAGTSFARSDGAGYYSLPVSARQGDLIVMKPGYREQFSPYALPSEANGTSRETPGEGPDLELEPAAYLAGRVVGPEGEPVAGADILLQVLWRGTRADRRLVTRSDDQGAFRWSMAPTETVFALRAEAEGFAGGELEITALEPRERREDIVLALERGSIGVGWVLDQLENPVSGAEIRVFDSGERDRARYFMPGRQHEDVYRSNAEGRFEVPGLLAGRYDLEAKASGHAPLLVRGIEIPEGSGELDLGTLVLAPGVALEGRVRDPDGQPIDGAMVMVGNPGEARYRLLQLNFGVGSADAHSGRDGRFVVADRTEGEALELAVAKEGYVSAQTGAVTVPGERPLEVTLKPASRILGRVVDADRQPVAEAQIVAQRDGHGNMGWSARFGGAKATSRDDGSFDLGGVEPGLVTVIVQAAGYSTLVLSGLEVPELAPLEGVELVLEAGASLVGTVFGADGEPAGQAMVMVAGSGRLRTGRGYTQADADGQYRLEGLATGAQMVTASLENGASTTKAVEIEPGENRLDLRLAAGVEVRGRVVGPSGEPIEGAAVEIQASHRHFFFGGSEEVSREGGAFVLENVAPGRYTLGAEREGFAPGKLEDIEVGESPVDGLVITLGAGITLRGRVLGLDPEELPLVAIRPQNEWRRVARPDYEGRYQMENLAPGEHVITAEVEQRGRRTQATVVLEEGIREAELNLEFGEGHVVTGTLFHGQERLSGVSLGLHGIDVGYSSARVVSAHDGTFRFADVPEGRHKLNVYDHESGLRHQEEVDIRGDEDLRVDIVTGQLAGRVVHDDGSSAGGASIQLEEIGDERRGRRFTETDVQGRFRFANVGEGTWKVRASKSGHGPAEEAVELRGSEIVDSLLLRLEPAAALVLDLQSTTGARPSYLRASFVGPTQETAADGSFQADDDGRVLVDVVPEGSWRMLLYVPGFALVDRPITVPSQPQSIALVPEGRLKIAVPELVESPSPARLTLVGPAGPYPWVGAGGRLEQDTPIRGSGREIGHLTAGAWNVTVTAEDGRVWSGQAVVAAGGMVELEL